MDCESQERYNSEKKILFQIQRRYEGGNLGVASGAFESPGLTFINTKYFT